MPIFDPEKLAERARNLGSANGLRRVLVTIAPGQAQLEVEFWNTNGVAALLADPRAPHEIFPISGGHRVPAGASAGFVKVEQVAAGGLATSLSLLVRPIGDYSTYTLQIDAPGIDPVFSAVDFKFRPGCFSTDCAPEFPTGAPRSDPRIDYLAKDYDSFRHTLVTELAGRIPGWTPTSEADLTVTLLDLFAAAGDELSDYQDRVMNEAYLGTARKRVSLARHARLVDYHIDQGAQAHTWLALELVAGQEIDLAPGFLAWAGGQLDEPDALVFVTRDSPHMHWLVNEAGLYTWQDTKRALAAGDTSADLKVRVPGQAAADTVRDLIRDGKIPRLVIQEQLNPATGRPPGRDLRKRQLLRLIGGPKGADSVIDPVTGEWMVRVRWHDEDALDKDYCFVEFPGHGARVEDVSLFFGNLVVAHHGRPALAVFRDPREPLVGAERAYALTKLWGTLCPLPEDRPLAYRQRTDPEEPPGSTLEVEVIPPGGAGEIWQERISLVHSRDTDPHFMVETDELGRSVIRFGNGSNGLQLPDRSEVRCHFQVGRGIDGNVGLDTIVHAYPAAAAVESVWNSFDVTDGRDPEPREEIIRNAPEAFRARQLRAVTLADYARRAEEVPGVARAAARYGWTGSWRTVRVAIDPAGTEVLSDALPDQVVAHLEAVRLIGEDLEIRPPIYVPARIEVSLCVAADVWPDDLRFVIDAEFGTGFTPDGQMAFFNPDRWTFGQALHGSEIEGRLQAIPGVDHVVSVVMRRFDAPSPGDDDPLEMAANEILRVHNDPDHLELGTIDFFIRGGPG
jgi:hypothetical protein